MVFLSAGDALVHSNSLRWMKDNLNWAIFPFTDEDLSHVLVVEPEPPSYPE